MEMKHHGSIIHIASGDRFGRSLHKVKQILRSLSYFLKLHTNHRPLSLTCVKRAVSDHIGGFQAKYCAAEE